MSWNYRVVRRSIDKTGQVAKPFLAIHEAYYDEGQEDERPRTITHDPITISGDSVEELQEVLKIIERSLGEPVLDWEDFSTSNK